MTKQLHHRRESCRLCGGRRLARVLDLGNVALAGGFLEPEAFATEAMFPLSLHFCEDCHFVQVLDVVAPEHLFARGYFYFSSAIRTLDEHFAAYARELTLRFLRPGKSRVVEMGCNDGVLLKHFRELGVATVGVDPATNVTARAREQGIDVIDDFFSERVASEALERSGPADAILANNVFAHVDDMNDVARGVARLLAPDGVFVFEAHYLGSVLEGMQYDMIYHEHLSYYSLIALEPFLERHGLEIFDVRPIPIHAGSMRYYARRRGGRHGEPISAGVAELRAEERARGYDRLERYQDYARSVADARERLLDLLGGLSEEGRSIAGYGASGRANTIIQYCGLGPPLIDYVIDDAAAKQGFYTPGSHLPIRPPSVLDAERPDFLLVFAWSFLDEIRRRRRDYLSAGGRMIVPLPEPRIV